MCGRLVLVTALMTWSSRTELRATHNYARTTHNTQTRSTTAMPWHDERIIAWDANEARTCIVCKSNGRRVYVHSVGTSGASSTKAKDIPSRCFFIIENGCPLAASERILSHADIVLSKSAFPNHIDWAVSARRRVPEGFAGRMLLEWLCREVELLCDIVFSTSA